MALSSAQQVNIQNVLCLIEQMQEFQPVMVYPAAAVPAEASTEAIYDAAWHTVAEVEKGSRPSVDKQTVITDFWCLKGTGTSSKVISIAPCAKIYLTTNDPDHRERRLHGTNIDAK